MQQQITVCSKKCASRKLQNENEAGNQKWLQRNYDVFGINFPVGSSNCRLFTLVKNQLYQHDGRPFTRKVVLVTNPHPILGRYIVPDMPTADELLPYLRQIDQNRWYSNFGPLVTQFEKKLTQFVLKFDVHAENAPMHLTTVMTCYHALQLGLKLFRLPENANVLIPAVTFPACPLAVRHVGAEAVLVDIDADNWQLTPKIAKRIAAEMPVHAVMPVALYGVPVDAQAWDVFTDETGIPVIIDAAAAFEAQELPKKSLVAHSMHATKPFCIGEGGILASRNSEWIDEVRCLSNFGTLDRITLKDGMNAKLTEYAGAVGLAQLDRWAESKQKRNALFTRYQAALAKAKLPVSFQPGIDKTIVSALMLQTQTASAAHIAQEMNVRGIFAHRMYLPPLYHHPFLADLKVVNTEGRALQGSASLDEKSALMKNAEHLKHHLFGLPFHNFMGDAEIDYTMRALAEVIEQAPASKV